MYFKNIAKCFLTDIKLLHCIYNEVVNLNGAGQHRMPIRKISANIV